ncbi:hypothetical protein F5Y04DRAFT_242655 [Hypomontagnella monticulosa]|nr:hypothetical protein F5Y04DRAFT_242655 [Hypomontagnella monticulosa]
MITALQHDDNGHSTTRLNGPNNLDQDLFHRIHAHRHYETPDLTLDLAIPSQTRRDNNQGTVSPSLSDNDVSLFSFVAGLNAEGAAGRQHFEHPDIETLFPLVRDLGYRADSAFASPRPADSPSAFDRWVLARNSRGDGDTASPSQPDGPFVAPDEESARTQSSQTSDPAEGAARARSRALMEDTPQIPGLQATSDWESRYRDRLQRERVQRDRLRYLAWNRSHGVDTSAPDHNQTRQARDSNHPYRRRRGQHLIDQLEPSSFSHRRHRVRYVDGLGDRDRSLSPEGDGVWDTLQSTLTPDPQPPSVGSSFTSTTSSAAASQTLSVPSSRTSISPGVEAEPPCDPVSEPDGVPQDSGNAEARRADRPRRPTPHGRRSYADVAADSYPHPDDPEWLSGMHRIVSGLASRQDIPDEWWAQAGLSRSMSWEGSN